MSILPSSRRSDLSLNKILHDSLASLCHQSLPSPLIHIIKNDTLTLPQLLPLLSSFTAIIIGPGPGSPTHAQDVGIIPALYALPNAHLLPIFGVCLGLQSLGVAFGAKLRRLRVVKHGQISEVVHGGVGIFEGVGEVRAVRYHSLCVDLPSPLPPSTSVFIHTHTSAAETTFTSELEELAHVDDELTENGRVIMALRHRTKPFYAVQYHPESVCTSGGGLQVLQNFFKIAEEWNAEHGRVLEPLEERRTVLVGAPWPRARTALSSSSSSPRTAPRKVHTTTLTHPSLSSRIPELCEALGVLEDDGAPFVLLDSAAAPGRFSIIACLTPHSPVLSYRVGERCLVQTTSSRFSSSSSPSPPGGSSSPGGARIQRHELGDTQDVWSWLKDYMDERRAEGGAEEVPFWGGLVGCVSYEAGVAGSGIPLDARRPRFAEALRPSTAQGRGEGERRKGESQHSDFNLVFVERSVVIDTHTGRTYVQSIVDGDEAWVRATGVIVGEVADKPIGTGLISAGESEATVSAVGKPVVTLPNKERYIRNINAAKEALYAGESYELCLTARTKVAFPAASSSSSRKSKTRPSSSWDKYKKLRASNPAPFSAYIRLQPTTLLSTSPERFLSYSRPTVANSSSSSSSTSTPHKVQKQLCQLRPIKGTLRKSRPGSDSPITRAEAEHLLRGSAKEVAENLMIVDLIRHDLGGVLGPRVNVKSFCGVEEYETVWQMVSVVEGVWEAECGHADGEGGRGGGVGWEVLRHSLPPG